MVLFSPAPNGRDRCMVALNDVIMRFSVGQPQPKLQVGETFHESGGSGCAWAAC